MLSADERAEIFALILLTAETPWVLSKFHPSLHEWMDVHTVGRMYERTILSEPKFLGCIDNQIFLRWLG